MQKQKLYWKNTDN